MYRIQKDGLEKKLVRAPRISEKPFDCGIAAGITKYVIDVLHRDGKPLRLSDDSQAGWRFPFPSYCCIDQSLKQVFASDRYVREVVTGKPALRRVPPA